MQNKTSAKGSTTSARTSSLFLRRSQFPATETAPRTFYCPSPTKKLTKRQKKVHIGPPEDERSFGERKDRRKLSFVEDKPPIPFATAAQSLQKTQCDEFVGSTAKIVGASIERLHASEDLNVESTTPMQSSSSSSSSSFPDSHFQERMARVERMEKAQAEAEGEGRADVQSAVDRARTHASSGAFSGSRRLGRLGEEEEHDGDGSYRTVPPGPAQLAHQPPPGLLTGDAGPRVTLTAGLGGAGGGGDTRGSPTSRSPARQGLPLAGDQRSVPRARLSPPSLLAGDGSSLSTTAGGGEDVEDASTSSGGSSGGVLACGDSSLDFAGVSSLSGGSAYGSLTTAERTAAEWQQQPSSTHRMPPVDDMGIGRRPHYALTTAATARLSPPPPSPPPRALWSGGGGLVGPSGAVGGPDPFSYVLDDSQGGDILQQWRRARRLALARAQPSPVDEGGPVLPPAHHHSHCRGLPTARTESPATPDADRTPPVRPAGYGPLPSAAATGEGSGGGGEENGAWNHSSVKTLMAGRPLSPGPPRHTRCCCAHLATTGPPADPSPPAPDPQCSRCRPSLCLHPHTADAQLGHSELGEGGREGDRGGDRGGRSGCGDSRLPAPPSRPPEGLHCARGPVCGWPVGEECAHRQTVPQCAHQHPPRQCRCKCRKRKGGHSQSQRSSSVVAGGGGGGGHRRDSSGWDSSTVRSDGETVAVPVPGEGPAKHKNRIGMASTGRNAPLEQHQQRQQQQQQQQHRLQDSLIREVVGANLFGPPEASSSLPRPPPPSSHLQQPAVQPPLASSKVKKITKKKNDSQTSSKAFSQGIEEVNEQSASEELQGEGQKVEEQVGLEEEDEVAAKQRLRESEASSTGGPRRSGGSGRPDQPGSPCPRAPLAVEDHMNDDLLKMLIARAHVYQKAIRIIDAILMDQ